MEYKFARKYFGPDGNLYDAGVWHELPEEWFVGKDENGKKVDKLPAGAESREVEVVVTKKKDSKKAESEDKGAGVDL